MAVKRAEQNPWILRCPQGHSSIDIHKQSFRCRSCGGVYQGQPFDVREHEFPVEDAPGVVAPDRERILAALVVMVDQKPTRGTTQTQTIATAADRALTIKQAGQALSRLEDDGFAERVSGTRWRPTDRGREHVHGGVRDGE